MASGLSSGQKPTGVTDLDSVQTLENKTLDSSSSVNGAPITGSDIISPTRADVKKDTLANLQTYALTAANGQLCFATDAKKMYQVLDAALAEVGTGSGGINYIPNPDFELNADGWVGDTNLTIARSTSAPLRDTASGVISKADTIDATGQVVKTIPFTIDAADLAKKLYISADVDASDANYADGDLRWKIVKDPNGTPVTIRPNAEDILGGNFSRLAWFQSDATITEYELQIECNSANTSAYSIKIDNVSVGPREAAFGSAMTDVKTYTPTFSASWGTTSNVDFTYSRSGEYLVVTGRFTFGTTTAAEAQIGLPDNLTISSKITTAQQVGSWVHNTTVEAFSGAVLATGGDTFFNVGKQGAGTGGGQVLNANSNGSNRTILLYARVPIEGWSSNALMSEDIGNREVVVRGAGNGGTFITDSFTNIDFTEVEDTTASWNGTQFTAPETGHYSVEGSLRFTASLGINVLAYIDGSQSKSIGGSSSQSTVPFSGVIKLNKGEVLSIRISTDATLSNSSSLHHIHIQKLAQPQTLLETETVAARYAADDGQAIASGTPIEYTTKYFDTHNAYNTTTGVYTVPVNGIYDLKATAFAVSPGDFIRLSFRINGSTILGITSVRYSAGTNYTGFANELLELNKGDTVEVWIDGMAASTNISGTPGRSAFSIAKIK